MTSDSRLVLPLIESSDLSDEDRKLVKAILWRDGATPVITTHEQYIRYQRIVAELSANMVPQPETRFHSSDRRMVSC